MRRAGGATATAKDGLTHEELELPCMGRENEVAGGGAPALLPSFRPVVVGLECLWPACSAHQGRGGYTSGRGGWRCTAVSEFASKDLDFPEI